MSTAQQLASTAGSGAAVGSTSDLTNPHNPIYGPIGPDGFPTRTLKRKAYYKDNYVMEMPARYEMKELVGRGAYGVVVSAEDTVTKEVVAIKKIGNMFADVVDGKRILREMKLLHYFSEPKHPNVLSLRDVFRSRKSTIVCNSLAAQFAKPGEAVPLSNVNASDFFADVYLVTDFIATDLQKVLKHQQLTEDHAGMFVYQMCCGLHFIHSGGVIHRDIKPANMLCSETCELQIADFGLARCNGADNLTNYVITRWYRPPEILLACETYDGKVDTWGIGCLAVEILSGRPLFPGNDYINQLVLITDEIGRPDEADLEHIESEEAIAFIKTLPERSKGFDVITQLRKHLPKSTASSGSNAPFASDLMLDFVAKLLVFAPSKRMSALEAMQHPWLDSFREPGDEKILPTRKFQWEYEDTDLTLEQLKQFTKEAVDEATLENWRDAA